MLNGKLIEIDIDKLILDPTNAREHPEKNLRMLKESLKEFGQQRVIVIDKNNKIIAGNGTVICAKELGWTKIHALVTSLDEVKAKAYAIADNQIATTSEWNLEMYSLNLKDLKSNGWDDWNSIGFEKDELELLLSADWSDFKEVDKNNQPDTDDIKEKVKPIKVTKEQREIFEQALSRLRENENNANILEGQAIEYFSADFLSGN